MPSFKFDVSADEEFALDFAAQVHKALVDAFHQRSVVDGMSKADVAEVLKMSKSRISRILSSEPHNPTLETVGRICWALGKYPRLMLDDVELPQVFATSAQTQVNLRLPTDNAGSSPANKKTVSLRLASAH